MPKLSLVSFVALIDLADVLVDVTRSMALDVTPVPLVSSGEIF